MSPILIGHSPAQRPVASELWRRVVAHLLRGASAALARRARQIARPLHERQRRPQPVLDPTVEFHAEAGAPEGALYIDGVFIGHVACRRL